MAIGPAHQIATNLQALQDNRPTSLRLWDGSFSDPDATALASAIVAATKLKSLDLRYCKSEDAGWSAIAQSALTNPALTSASLRASRFGSGTRTIKFERLSIFEKVGPERSPVKYIRCCCCNSGKRAKEYDVDLQLSLAFRFRSSSFLGRFSFGKQMGLALAPKLASNTSLKSLNLGSNLLGDSSGAAICQVLGANTSITSLNLKYNLLGRKSSKAVCQMLSVNRTLTYLNLRGNYLGGKFNDSICSVLAFNEVLLKLDLGDNYLESEGLETLGTALAANKCLTSLNLGENDFREVGILPIVPGLSINSSLKSLNLEHCSLGSTALMSIFQMLIVNSGLAVLHLGYNDFKKVEISPIVQALSINSSLKLLNLRNCNLGCSGAMSICQILIANSSLTDLDLSYNDFEYDEIKIIVKALASNMSLTSLSLSGNRLSSEKFAPLRMESTDNFTLQEKNRDLDINSILPKILFFEFEVDLDGISQVLVSNTNLTLLDLSESNIADLECDLIAKRLEGNNSLTHLDLRGNRMEIAGYAAIGEALKKNSSLRSLKMSSPDAKFMRLGFKDAAGEAIIKGLNVNSSLISFNALKPRYCCPALSLNCNEIYSVPISRQIVDLTERNIHNSERKDSLEIHCARALVQKVFINNIDRDSKNGIYFEIWRDAGEPSGDFRFGENNAFRLWSRFAQAVQQQGIDLASRTLQIYMLPNGKGRSYIEGNFSLTKRKEIYPWTKRAYGV